MTLKQAIVRHLLNTQMSLADLQNATQVSLPTLRRAVQELADARWIRIVGQAEANGGRPAMLFGVDNGLFAVIGVHLQLPGIRLILADLNGQALDEVELFDSVVPAPEACVQAVAGYAAAVRERFPQRQVLGVGIAAPGFIDLDNGDILSIGRVPAWGSFPICRRLQAALSLPVGIANDVDCMAFAELHDTHAPRGANLAYIGFDEGVKISLFLKGELHKGTLGNAGLIAAHLLRVPELAASEAAPQLLTINGMSQVFEARLAALDAAARRDYAGILQAATVRERVQQILQQAGPTLPLCQALVHEQLKVLAVTAANMTLLLQPDIIVVGGLLSLLPLNLFVLLEAEIRRHLPDLVSNNTIIRQGRLAAQSSAAIGASHHFLQTFLDNTVSSLA